MGNTHLQNTIFSFSQHIIQLTALTNLSHSFFTSINVFRTQTADMRRKTTNTFAPPETKAQYCKWENSQLWLCMPDKLLTENLSRLIWPTTRFQNLLYPYNNG